MRLGNAFLFMGPLQIFFCQVSVQVFCPFFSWAVVFFIWRNSLHMVDLNHHRIYELAVFLLPLCGSHFPLFLGMYLLATSIDLLLKFLFLSIRTYLS